MRLQTFTLGNRITHATIRPWQIIVVDYHEVESNKLYYLHNQTKTTVYSNHPCVQQMFDRISCASIVNLHKSPLTSTSFGIISYPVNIFREEFSDAIYLFKFGVCRYLMYLKI